MLTGDVLIGIKTALSVVGAGRESYGAHLPETLPKDYRFFSPAQPSTESSAINSFISPIVDTFDLIGSQLASVGNGCLWLHQHKACDLRMRKSPLADRQRRLRGD